MAIMRKGSPMEFNKNEKWLTILLYPNSDDWHEEWGGHLRLFPGAPCSQVQGAGDYVDIAPRGGRLVCFRSREMLHQVMPTRHDRFLVSVWISAVTSSD